MSAALPLASLHSSTSTLEQMARELREKVIDDWGTFLSKFYLIYLATKLYMWHAAFHFHRVFIAI